MRVLRLPLLGKGRVHCVGRAGQATVPLDCLQIRPSTAAAGETTRPFQDLPPPEHAHDASMNYQSGTLSCVHLHT